MFDIYHYSTSKTLSCENLIPDTLTLLESQGTKKHNSSFIWKLLSFPALLKATVLISRLSVHVHHDLKEVNYICVYYLI